MSHDIWNFEEGRNYSVVPLIYLQCWESLPKKEADVSSKIYVFREWEKHCKI